MSEQLMGVDAIGNVIVPPPEVLLAWQTDAYPHGERRSWMPAYSIPMLVVSTLLVALRLTLRMRKRGGGFGLDDAFLVPSWMLLVAYTAVVCWSSMNGTLDRHMWDIEPLKYQTVALSAWLGQLVFLAGTCLIRISILLFFRRMVKGTFRKRWTWSVWAAIGFTVAWTLALIIMLLATCDPVEANWKVFDPYYEKQWTCADTRASSYAAGVLAVLSDTYSLVLPWAMTWPLEMPRRQKVALNMVFSVGVIVVVAACFRTKHAVDLGSDYDSTWTGFWVYFWTLLEWNLAIICNCAPSLRAFFRAYLKDTVDKALNSLSSRSRYRETTKSHTMSTHNIELKRTYTIHSEKSLNHTDSQAGDASSTNSDRTDYPADIPEAHLKKGRQSTFLDMDPSPPPQFAPNQNPWARSQVDITITGPASPTRPYAEV